MLAVGGKTEWWQRKVVDLQKHKVLSGWGEKHGGQEVVVDLSVVVLVVKAVLEDCHAVWRLQNEASGERWVKRVLLL